jgi:hypothetical protein
MSEQSIRKDLAPLAVLIGVTLVQAAREQRIMLEERIRCGSRMQRRSSAASRRSGEKFFCLLLLAASEGATLVLTKDVLYLLSYMGLRLPDFSTKFTVSGSHSSLTRLHSGAPCASSREEIGVDACDYPGT